MFGTIATVATAALGTAACCAIFAGVYAARAQTRPLTFDVASVKPAKVPDGVTEAIHRVHGPEGHAASIQAPNNAAVAACPSIP
jgi:hypothetical protein